MKTKTLMAVMLSGALSLSVLSGCGEAETAESTVNNGASIQTSSEEESTDIPENSEESKSETDVKKTSENTKIHTLYIRDAGKSDKVTAEFFNTMSDAKTTVEMKKADEGDDYTTYSCEGDTTLYNMVHITYESGSQSLVSKDVSFNNYVAGWYLKDNTLLPYAEGMDLKYDPKFDTKTFKFDGEDKEVYIWTPDDYDKTSEDKYSTIYMFDGQTVLATGVDRGMDSDTECWNVSQSVEGMMSLTDNKAIIVCITNLENRDDELIPDLGDLAKGQKLDTKKRGNVFADFICDTIMPYVQENYNVYTDAQHTSLAGSSFGGLETFYAVLTHPDKFGTAGVLSASFQVYDSSVWEKFLSDKYNMENAPFLYFYAGGYGTDNGNVNEPVYNSLIEKGYPKDKLVYDKYEPGTHIVPCWRNIYSEFLQAVFKQKIDALENGLPVKYADNNNPFENIPEEVSIDPNDPRLNEKDNYIYFDNSETKWDNVYAYWWDAIPTNKISGGLYGAEWPGIQLEKIEGTEIYRMVMPMGPTLIVFSSGITDAEVMNGTTAYQTANMPYDDQKNAGQIFRIDVAQEAKPAAGKKFKTKFIYPAGEWTDYNP